MNNPQKIDKFIPWIGLIVSLINTIWLILITLSQGNSLGTMSVKSVLLIIFSLLTGCAMLLLRTQWVKLFFAKHLSARNKILSYLAFGILILSLFFLLMPLAKYRWKVTYEIWLRVLPIGITYAVFALLWFLHRWFELKTQPTIQSRTSSREIFVDFVRGFAIILAVGSHVFYAFGYDILFGKSMVQVMSLTRLATPSFILITGMMFEMVYLPKAEKQGFKPMAGSLISRSLQCYGAYVITVLIEWFDQRLNTISAQYAVVLLGKSLYSNILKFYALFLLLAIPVIWLRRRFGIWLITSLPLAVWLGDLLLDRMSWPATNQPLAHLTGILFGHPNGSFFSVWHSLTFMSFGMLLGFMLKRSKQVGNWNSFQTTLWLLTLVCLVVSLMSVLPSSWEAIFYNFSNDYRTNHQIPYYSIGSIGAFLLLWIGWKLRRFLNHPWLENSITALGKNSLWAFAVGNSLVAILPAQNGKTWNVILFFLAVFVGSVGVIKIKNLARS